MTYLQQFEKKTRYLVVVYEEVKKGKQIEAARLEPPEDLTG